MVSLVGQTISHYKILEHLGGGGMGVVYKAQDLKLDRPVALKFLSPELTRDSDAKQRFVHEAKAASALQHSNICVVHDVDETDDGQMFISMEYLEGETLKKRIDRGPLKILEAIDITVQVAQGLMKAHEHGIVHRDIKPTNIMITADGVAKVVDFGLAKLSELTMLTKTGSTLGTVTYMSPEQTRGQQVDRRTDIWALGVVLYEMITGRAPFRGDYENAVIYSILNETIEPLTGLRSGVPMELEEVVNKALAKAPEDRYQHVDEMVVDLRGLRRQSERGAGSPVTQSSKARTAPLRRRIFTLVAGIAIGALILVGIWFLSGRFQGPGLEDKTKSLAVLPLNTVIRTDDDKMFADGIHGEILTRLTKIKTLEVKAQTSVMRYRDTKKPISEIGKELGVNYIVEGGIRKAEGRIRIHVQLIDAQNENQIWAETYDQQYADIFAIESEIAHRIASGLKTTLTPNERSSIERKPTENLEAYEYYLRGNYYWEVGLTKAENEKAAEMYGKAISLDPDFALAYARLAKVQSTLIVYDRRRTPERISLARRALERAVALAPDLAEVHLAEAVYCRYAEPDSMRAWTAYQFALAGDPNNPLILFSAGDFLLVQGKAAEANDLFVKMAEFNPGGVGTIWVIASYFFMRNFKDAERWTDLMILRNPADDASYSWKWNVVAVGLGDTARGRAILEDAQRNTKQECDELRLRIAYYARDFKTVLQLLGRADVRWWLPFFPSKAFLYELMGQHAKATSAARAEVAQLSRLIEEQPIVEHHRMQLALTQAILGKREEALSEADKLLQSGLKMYNWGRELENGVAMIHMVLGNHDEAISRLEYLATVPSMVNKARLKFDLMYDPLRNNPRFHLLLTKTE